jgi:anaerobic selenocysteine-containing dehydrogenase
MELMMYVQEHMELMKILPVVIAETLGPVLGSYNQALIVALFIAAGKPFKIGAQAMGFPEPDDPTGAEVIFEDVLKHPEGQILARFQGENFRLLKTEDKKINLRIEELDEPVKNATIENEKKALEPSAEFPMFLHSGLHHETVINTALRNPAWNKGRDADNMFINEADAKRLGVADGDTVKITTAASSATIKVEISPYTTENFVYIRHGRGLIYDGVKYGVNVNELVKGTVCDEMYTPMHRRVPCRVEKA